MFLQDKGNVRKIQWLPKKFLENYFFEDIWFGENHGCALTIEKRVFTWGSNENLSIGNPLYYLNDFVNVEEPFEIILKEKEEICHVFVQKNTNVILTTKSVHIWGDWNDNNLHFPNKILFPQKQLIKVSAGKGFLVAVSQEFEIFSVGLNKFGQV
jgi:alpha-tubulin suppressor-like RCC1 family protein